MKVRGLKILQREGRAKREERERERGRVISTSVVLLVEYYNTHRTFSQRINAEKTLFHQSPETKINSLDLVSGSDVFVGLDGFLICGWRSRKMFPQQIKLLI